MVTCQGNKKMTQAETIGICGGEGDPSHQVRRNAMHGSPTAAP